MVEWSPAKALVIFGIALLLLSIFTFWSINTIELEEPTIAEIQFNETPTGVSIEILSVDSSVTMLNVYVNDERVGTIQPIEGESIEVQVSEGESVTVTAESSDDSEEISIDQFVK